MAHILVVDDDQGFAQRFGWFWRRKALRSLRLEMESRRSSASRLRHRG
jgi:hypothetical protein